MHFQIKEPLKLYFHCIRQINIEDFHEHKRHSPCNVSGLISLTNLHCFVHTKDQNALLLDFTSCLWMLGVSSSQGLVLLGLSLCLLSHSWHFGACVQTIRSKKSVLSLVQNVYLPLGNTLFISEGPVQNMGGH